jgi:hypothetical protein
MGADYIVYKSLVCSGKNDQGKDIVEVVSLGSENGYLLFFDSDEEGYETAMSKRMKQEDREDVIFDNGRWASLHLRSKYERLCAKACVHIDRIVKVKKAVRR